MNISLNATKLLNALKTFGSLYEEKAIEILFPKPQYVGTMDANFTAQAKINIQTSYWQWEENLYGNGSNRPVNGVPTDFKMNVDKSYADVTRAAFAELKNAGLAYSKNNGYNTYSYYPISK